MIFDENWLLVYMKAKHAYLSIAATAIVALATFSFRAPAYESPLVAGMAANRAALEQACAELTSHAESAANVETASR